MGWAAARDRLHRRVTATFKDGLATYTGPNGEPPVSDISVIIDRNLMQNGPEGIFKSDAVGLSWRVVELCRATRGGVFTVGAERFTVEEAITDDGHMITAACMVTP